MQVRAERVEEPVEQLAHDQGEDQQGDADPADHQVGGHRVTSGSARGPRVRRGCRGSILGKTGEVLCRFSTRTAAPPGVLRDRPAYCPVAHARRRRPARRRPGDPLRGRPQQRQPPARPAAAAPRRARPAPPQAPAADTPRRAPARAPARAAAPGRGAVRAAARPPPARHPAGPAGPRAQPPVPLAAVLEGRPRLVPRPGGARPDRLLRRLPADRHPAAERLRRRPDHDRLLQRRQERDGPVRGAGPHHRRERPDPAARQGRDRRRRGPDLLREPRRLAGRPRPGRVGPGERGLRRGRLDDHPAVREELLPDLRPDVLAQGQGSHHRAEDRPAADQGRDAHRVPQHHLLRPRRVRHPGRGAGRTSARTPPTSRSRRARCWPASSPTRAAGTRRRTRRRPPNGSSTSSTAWCSARPCRRASATRWWCRRRSSRSSSRPTPAPTATCWRWCAASCSRTARSPTPTWTPAALRITTTISRGVQAAAIRAMNDPEAFPVEDRPATLHAALTSIDPSDRRHRGPVRRRRLPDAAVERRHPGRRPGGLDLQAVHARRRARGRHRAEEQVGRAQQPHLRRLRRLLRQREAGAELRRVQLRRDHPGEGDGQLGQHRLRRRQRHGRAGEDARGGRARRPARGHRRASTTSCPTCSAPRRRTRSTWPPRTRRSRPRASGTPRTSSPR